MLAYKYLVWAVLLIFGVAGGWLAWWHVTKTLYLRDAGSEVFGNAKIKPNVLMRRQVWRFIWTAAGAAGGLLVGMIALTTLTRFQN